MSVFRFDAGTHTYTEDGQTRPHITGMLEASGWIDSRWYTEESSERGTQIHRLTADFDLGAVDLVTCVSRYRPYLLGHVAAMKIVRPDILAVEEPMISPLGFGGRPDRELEAWGLISVLEGKSGDPEKSHQVQTALQAILVAPKYALPPESIARLCLYWKASGKFRLEEHRERKDFDEARRIIRTVCG